MARTAKKKSSFFTEDQKKRLEKTGMLPIVMEAVAYLPSGLSTLDSALGGGFPIGRITEISGLNHSGKTTIALIAAGTTVANGGLVAYIDGEHALDKNLVTEYIPREEIYWGDEYGLLEDTRFHVYEPEFLEAGLEGLRELAQIYDLVIYDSIAGSPTRGFLEAPVGSQFYSPVARIMGIFKGVVAQNVKAGGAAVVFLNHVTTVIGGVINPLLPYGGTLKPSGGEGMGFVCTIRIMMYNAKKLDMPESLKKEIKEEVQDDKFVYGRQFEGTIFKNKLLQKYSGLRSFDFQLIHYPKSFINKPYDIVEAAKQLHLLEQRGAHWYYQGEHVASSRNEMENIIADSNNPKGYEIEAALQVAIAALSKDEQDDPEQEQERTQEVSAELFPEAE